MAITRPERVRALLGPLWVGAVLVAVAVPGVRAQDATITGRIVSLVGGEPPAPVPGVTVRVPELGVTGVSDAEGRFELRDVPPGTHRVRAGLLGCDLGGRAVTVDAGGTASVDFRLTAPAIVLPGVVATAASARAPDAEATYSVGEVDAAGREGHAGRSIADLIRGHLPGVRIRESGQAGGEISIQLRGPTSISGSQAPLVVIDGVITSGGFVDINPSDVERVRVLKGAAAAAEYGARGEAGVIEIFTAGASAPTPAGRGPLVVVDGSLREEGLSRVDPATIRGMETLTGARAEVLFGVGAGEVGVLRIRTDTAEGAGALRGCAPPPP